MILWLDITLLHIIKKRHPKIYYSIDCVLAQP